MKEKKLKAKTRLILVIVVGILSLLAAGYLILCQAVQDNVIWKNVSINGVNLKGMTVEEAQQAVQEKFEADYQDAAVTVVLEDQQFEVSLNSLLTMDASKEIQEAYATGHGAWGARGLEWLMTRMEGTKEVTVSPEISDEDLLDQAIQNSGILDYAGSTASTWEQTETELIVHKGITGAAPDEEQLKQAVLDAAAGGKLDEPISCPVKETAPQAPDFQTIGDSLYREPVNASLDAANNYAVTESITGISLDAEQAQQAYDAAGEGTDVVIPLTVTEPAITTESMNANLFKDVLGTYQSTVTGTGGKIQNISLAAGMCDGIVLLPGETFSYNGIIGDTTEERGFQLANAYSDGEVIQEPGGGVCQVSSTIFSALLQTDLEVVQRQNHSMIVTYVPYGMDATVSWTQPDFQFKNNHSYPIRLSVEFDGSVITVQIIGTQESDLSVECRVEQTGEMTYETYRDYYDSNGNLVNTEYVCHSEYKPLP